MTTLAMPHHLERTVLVQAPREIVFNYFTDSARWARWWGQGSTIEPRPGGAVHIPVEEAMRLYVERMAGRPDAAETSRRALDRAWQKEAARPRIDWRRETPASARRLTDRLFDAYADLLPVLQAWFATQHPKAPQDSDFVWRQSVRAKAFDALRGLLPAAASSNLGIYASGQAFEARLHALARANRQLQ